MKSETNFRQQTEPIQFDALTLYVNIHREGDDRSLNEAINVVTDL
jgi:hypothetical protein